MINEQWPVTISLCDTVFTFIVSLLPTDGLYSIEIMLVYRVVLLLVDFPMRNKLHSIQNLLKLGYDIHPRAMQISIVIVVRLVQPPFFNWTLSLRQNEHINVNNGATVASHSAEQCCCIVIYYYNYDDYSAHSVVCCHFLLFGYALLFRSFVRLLFLCAGFFFFNHNL